MKFLVLLPFTLSDPIQDALAENALEELQFGGSLCESGECLNDEGSSALHDEIIAPTGCNHESIMKSHLDRCEYYNASHSDCVEWTKKELDKACGDSFNCIQTSIHEFALYGTYWVSSSR